MGPLETTNAATSAADPDDGSGDASSSAAPGSESLIWPISPGPQSSGVDRSKNATPNTEVIDSEWPPESTEAAPPATGQPAAGLPFTDWSLPDPDEPTDLERARGYDPRKYLSETFCPRSRKTVLGLGEPVSIPRHVARTVPSVGALGESRLEVDDEALQWARLVMGRRRKWLGAIAVLTLGVAAAVALLVFGSQSSTVADEGSPTLESR